MIQQMKHIRNEQTNVSTRSSLEIFCYFGGPYFCKQTCFDIFTSSLPKMPYFHLIFWCGNFVETVPLYKISILRNYVKLRHFTQWLFLLILQNQFVHRKIFNPLTTHAPHSFSIKNILFEKMDLSFFYFHVTKYAFDKRLKVFFVFCTFLYKQSVYQGSTLFH